MPKWTDANDPMTILGKSSCPISLWPTVLKSVMEAGRTVKSSVTITNGKLDGVCLDKYVQKRANCASWSINWDIQNA